jgi:nucleoside-diphosphate-sugar epimerase
MGADLGYLVCAMVQALLSGSLLQVDEHDIARDYLHPADFSSALMAVMGSPPANVAYDLCSLAPVRKFDLLRRFQDQFGLQSQQSPWNGLPNKMNYYSEDFSLKELGFVPAMSSVDAVADQAATFLARRLAPNGG